MGWLGAARNSGRSHQVQAHYTLAESVSTSIPSLPRVERAAAAWPAWAAELPAGAGLADRTVGRPVTDHRSSWVRELSVPRGTIFVKTYEYATWADRLRDLGRRRAPWSTPRATREFEALRWQQLQGLEGPEPLAVLVWRHFGFVRRATLVTTAFPGAPADAVLPALDARSRAEVALAIGRLVGQLHRLGFRDGNLDLRNLLVRRDERGCHVAKIDSPRFRLRRPGPAEDRLARADWRRLLPQLAAFGLDEVARRAAAPD